jgi:hypothetical protein
MSPAGTGSHSVWPHDTVGPASQGTPVCPVSLLRPQRELSTSIDENQWVLPPEL